MTRMLVIALVTLGDPERLTGGYLYHRRMAELAPKHNASIEFVSFPDRPFPLPALAGRSVLRQVQHIGADVIVLDSIAAAFLGPWLAVRRPDVPIVAMLHQPPGGIDHGPLRTRLQAWLDRLAYAKACRLLVASDSLADELDAAGVPRERMRVVPPGRDVAASAGLNPTVPGSPNPTVAGSLNPALAAGTPPLRGVRLVPSRGSPAGDLRQGRRAAFLCVANWIERKGIHDLLEAFARLPNDTGTLHLVGDDRADPDYASRLRARLEQPDLADRVVVHGPLPREVVASLYQAADVFVLTSTKEPYGTVWGEAMAAGLPVVGWRAGNLPYLAEDGREGLLLEPGDLDALTRALELLANDEPLRRRLGEAAATRALTRPTWDESAALFFTAIREVL